MFTHYKYSIIIFLLVIFGYTHLYGQTKNNIMSIDDRIFPNIFWQKVPKF